jgi:hypothetical protein
VIGMKRNAMQRSACGTRHTGSEPGPGAHGGDEAHSGWHDDGEEHCALSMAEVAVGGSVVAVGGSVVAVGGSEAGGRRSGGGWR